MMGHDISDLTIRDYIKQYFKKHGLDVDIRIIYDPAFEMIRVIVIHKIALTMVRPVTLDILPESMQQMCEEAVHKLQEYLLSLLKVAFHGKHIIPNTQIDKYFLIFNPEKMDIRKVIEVLTLEEL